MVGTPHRLASGSARNPRCRVRASGGLRAESPDNGRSNFGRPDVTQRRRHHHRDGQIAAERHPCPAADIGARLAAGLADGGTERSRWAVDTEGDTMRSADNRTGVRIAPFRVKRAPRLTTSRCSSIRCGLRRRLKRGAGQSARIEQTGSSRTAHSDCDRSAHCSVALQDVDPSFYVSDCNPSAPRSRLPRCTHSTW